MSETKKGKYNLTVSRLYETVNKSGNYMSVEITPEEFDAIQKIGLGGRLLVKLNKFRKSEKSPHAYLEYLSKEEFEAMVAKLKNRAATASDSAEDTL